MSIYNLHFWAIPKRKPLPIHNHVSELSLNDKPHSPGPDQIPIPINLLISPWKKDATS